MREAVPSAGLNHTHYTQVIIYRTTLKVTDQLSDTDNGPSAMILWKTLDPGIPPECFFKQSKPPDSLMASVSANDAQSDLDLGKFEVRSTQKSSLSHSSSSSWAVFPVWQHILSNWGDQCHCGVLVLWGYVLGLQGYV